MPDNTQIIFQVVRMLVLLAVSFGTAFLLVPFFVRLLRKFDLTKKNIRDEASAPIFSRLHQGKSQTPTMGGVIIWGTVIVLALLFLILNKVSDGFWGYFNFVNRAQTYLPLATMLIAGLIGLFDDILGILKIGPSGGGLRMGLKIILYTSVAVVGAWWFYFHLGWSTFYIPFIGYFEIGWWYIPIFIFIIVATAFSTNETDGLDGLAGGTLLFAFGSLIVVSFVLGRYDLAAMETVVLGALLSFLWFNIYPAKFFMGDTGAMSLGVTLGVIAMLTNTAVFLPFFAVILVIESLSVIFQTISKKFFHRKIFLSTPIHHHFEAIGWPETQVTMRFWIISALSSAIGLVLFFLARFL
ncbi:MAG: phospho-N-acetylmuramoyl-pentapeptide-transferase [Candidatus Paceibacterota bacterium]